MRRFIAGLAVALVMLVATLVPTSLSGGVPLGKVGVVKAAGSSYWSSRPARRTVIRCVHYATSYTGVTLYHCFTVYLN